MQLPASALGTMSIPGHWARIRDAALIDFDVQPLVLMTRPSPASFAAWGAAEEAERRYLMYQWLAVYVPEPRNWRMFSEFASGFLLSFEVALQHFKKEFQAKARGTPDRFFPWIQSLSDPDDHPPDFTLFNVEFRGLRVLRHVVAHHELISLRHSLGDDEVSEFHGPSSGRTARRHFPRVTTQQYRALTSDGQKALPLKELPEWARRVRRTPAPRLMREGLRRLKHMMVAAEAKFK
jgi:hypothetical protein